MAIDKSICLFNQQSTIANQQSLKGESAMTINERITAKIGSSTLKDEKAAVRELFDKINQKDMEVVIFFCSSKYNLDSLGRELKSVFPCMLIGCTTAGEISSGGYQDEGIVGASLSSKDLKVHPHLITPLKNFDLSAAQQLAVEVQKELVFSDRLTKENMFGILLIDGMSILEEQIIASLHNQFEGISIAGGSAGDDLKFAVTKIYYDGRFLSDAAVITLFETTLPFYVFQTQHFRPTDKKLVITEADPARRIVMEINAEPAAQEYAEALGIPVSELGPVVFSRFPVMLRLGDKWYVRSIQKANEDGSLSFYCAIDKGLVLTIAEGHDIVSDLKQELDEISQKVPNASLILGCDCILRKLEIVEKGLMKEMNGLLSGVNIIGFSTYGEQFNSCHVNQTLTGIVIGG
jgi:hypothetical protein